MARKAGRHFLQVPGPSNVPEAVLLAMARATIDHRGPEFKALTATVLAGFERIFGFGDPVVIYPSSGTGAWVAALCNCLSAGDRVLAFETGHFATLWRTIAADLGLEVQFEAGDWRSAADPERLESILRADPERRIKAVCIVHNETSTGVTSDVGAARQAIDAAGHPALLLVDTISSLGSIPFDHQAWRVDVTIGCSQKGLMLPPGIGFNVVSQKARAAAGGAGLPKAYWEWEAIIAANAGGVFPYTPATHLLYGLSAALSLLEEEGIAAVYRRHQRHGRASRAALQAWGLDNVGRDPARRSDALTAVMLADGHDADAVRAIALRDFDLSLGTGLGKLAGRIFRIGHLGDFNDLMLLGTLNGVEIALDKAAVPIQIGGVAAAAAVLAEEPGA